MSKFVFMSSSKFNDNVSINKIILSKSNLFIDDIIDIIDDYLNGFAYYKLSEVSMTKSLRSKLTMLLRHDMKNYPRRISRCMMMLIMGNSVLCTSKIYQELSNVLKNNGLPISDDVFNTCCRYSLIEYVNRFNHCNYKLYSIMLSKYLSFAMNTKVYIIV